MGRKLRRILTVVLLAVFLFSVSFIIVVRYEYRLDEERYGSVAARFTSKAGGSGDDNQGAGASGGTGQDAGAAGDDGNPFTDTPPLRVDFEGLRAVNGDVIGWLYCEGTPIDYPVLQGEDNDAYLRHSYDGEANTAGSIFVEALNGRGFVDSNTIVYGHHMRNGSMFACLDQWAEEGFYGEHPVMWLLTPEQDYRIDIFAGYTTSGYSDTYTIFTGPCGELDGYLEKCIGQSDFSTGIEVDGRGKYVVLSTCAYVFTDARYVLHGVLVPVETAGGMPAGR